MKVSTLLLVTAIAASAQAKEKEHGITVIGSVLSGLPQPIVLMMQFVKDAFPEINEHVHRHLGPDYDVCNANAKQAKNTTVCQKRIELNNCLKPICEYYETQLPENSKDLCQVLVESTKALDEYICKSKLTDFLELLDECIMRTSGLYLPHKEHERGQHYKKQLKIFKATPTKDTLCQVVKSFMPMITDPVKTACKSETFKAYTGFLEASTKPCN